MSAVLARLLERCRIRCTLLTVEPLLLSSARQVIQGFSPLDTSTLLIAEEDIKNRKIRNDWCADMRYPEPTGSVSAVRRWEAACGADAAPRQPSETALGMP